MIEKEIVKQAVEKWGKQSQLLMVLEEMAELQKEILKNINRKKNNIDDIIDETADVEIMLAQLKYIFDIEQAVADRIPIKLQKVKARLEE